MTTPTTVGRARQVIANALVVRADALAAKDRDEYADADEVDREIILCRHIAAKITSATNTPELKAICADVDELQRVLAGDKS